jgi:protein-tyrosine phosphatase
VPDDPRSPAAPLHVPVTYNFRSAGAGTLRPGVLYRSDALHALTADGRRALADLGIRRVVDLRSRLDRRLGGRDRLRGVGVQRVSLPIDAAGARISAAGLTLRSVYRTILGPGSPQVAGAIREIADADGPVVVHCTAGKDRTGLVCALVLLAVGADRDAVVADYTASAANLAGAWADAAVRRMRRFRVAVDDDMRELLTGSPEQVLVDTLAWLDDEHGGVEAYLASLGVTDEVVDRLRTRLLPD